VGAGAGYYSLTTVIVSQMADPALGSVALLANMLREILTLTATPLLRRAGRLGPIMSGGATAMDTSLPVIARHCGERGAIIAVFSGIALSLLVPLAVSGLLSLR
jgi:uncharacterized membrane protein YbjE (DUF340 family)